MRPITLSLVIALAALLTACAEPIPSYPEADAAATLETVVQAHQQVDTIAGAGRLTLRDPGRGSVTLDAALVARQPDHIRVRAWKLNRPVADLTLQDDRLRVDLSDGFESDPFAEALTHVRNALPGLDQLAQPPARLDISGSRVHATWLTPEGEITCEVDRATRTVRRWTFSAGSVELDRYRLLEDGQVWPMRIIARATERDATFRFDWVEVNEALAPGALTAVNERPAAP